jgi:hypothetical protein
MNITSVIKHMDDETHILMCVIDGQTICVPLDPNNRHYAEILRQVAAGDLTIADAD